MLLKNLSATIAALIISSSAFAFSWTCEDSNTIHRYSLSDFNGGTFTVTPKAFGLSLGGRFWNFRLKQGWEMSADSFGASTTSCVTSDGGMGNTYQCTIHSTGFSYGLWNCVGSIF